MPCVVTTAVLIPGLTIALDASVNSAALLLLDENKPLLNLYFLIDPEHDPAVYISNPTAKISLLVSPTGNTIDPITTGVPAGAELMQADLIAGGSTEPKLNTPSNAEYSGNAILSEEYTLAPAGLLPAASQTDDPVTKLKSPPDEAHVPI